MGASSMARHRRHAVLALLPIGGWSLAHLWEQWSAFGGYRAYVERMELTSDGAAAIALEVALVLVPTVAWVVSGLSLARAEEPAALRVALAEEPATALRLGRLTRAGSALLALFLAYHVAWAWADKLLLGADPLRTLSRIQSDLGRPAHLALHAVGLTALALHLWAATPRLFAAFGWMQTVEGRRATRLSSLIVVVLLWALYAQLLGWLATGAGTFWPMAS